MPRKLKCPINILPTVEKKFRDLIAGATAMLKPGTTAFVSEIQEQILEEETDGSGELLIVPARDPSLAVRATLFALNIPGTSFRYPPCTWQYLVSAGHELSAVPPQQDTVFTPIGDKAIVWFMMQHDRCVGAEGYQDQWRNLATAAISTNATWIFADIPETGGRRTFQERGESPDEILQSLGPYQDGGLSLEQTAEMVYREARRILAATSDFPEQGEVEIIPEFEFQWAGYMEIFQVVLPRAVLDAQADKQTVRKLLDVQVVLRETFHDLSKLVQQQYGPITANARKNRRKKQKKKAKAKLKKEEARQDAAALGEDDLAETSQLITEEQVPNGQSRLFEASESFSEVVEQAVSQPVDEVTNAPARADQGSTSSAACLDTKIKTTSPFQVCDEGGQALSPIQSLIDLEHTVRTEDDVMSWLATNDAEVPAFLDQGDRDHPQGQAIDARAVFYCPLLYEPGRKAPSVGNEPEDNDSPELESLPLGSRKQRSLSLPGNFVFEDSPWGSYSQAHRQLPSDQTPSLVPQSIPVCHCCGRDLPPGSYPPYPLLAARLPVHLFPPDGQCPPAQNYWSALSRFLGTPVTTYDAGHIQAFGHEMSWNSAAQAPSSVPWGFEWTTRDYMPQLPIGPPPAFVPEFEYSEAQLPICPPPPYFDQNAANIGPRIIIHPPTQFDSVPPYMRPMLA